MPSRDGLVAGASGEASIGLAVLAGPGGVAVTQQRLVVHGQQQGLQQPDDDREKHEHERTVPIRINI
jgi:hypothetical protein